MVFLELGQNGQQQSAWPTVNLHPHDALPSQKHHLSPWDLHTRPSRNPTAKYLDIKFLHISISFSSPLFCREPNLRSTGVDTNRRGFRGASSQNQYQIEHESEGYRQV